MTDHQNASTLRLDLEISEEQVGPFLGPSGKNIRFLIGKTKRELNPDRDESVDLSNLHCKLEVDEGKVFATLSASEDNHLEALKQNVLHQQDYVMGRVEKKEKKEKKKPVKKNNRPKKVSGNQRFTTKYVFKTDMEHHMMSKFIGRGGSNVNELKDSIVLGDEHLEGNRMNVFICEDKKIRFKNLHFELLKTDFDSESKVLITIELNTKNRQATLETVRKYVKQFVEKANLSNYSNNQVSFTPVEQDSGELENPF